MKKIETIWHHLLYSALEENNFKHTQEHLAKKFGYSLSTVNYALSVPSKIGAIRKESKFFVLADFKKLLYYYSSVRNLPGDLIYQTYLDFPIVEIEGLIPPKSIYAAYTAGRLILKEAPADYDKIYFYSDQGVNYLRIRFPENKKKASNIFVLKAIPELFNYGKITTVPQTFADLWNLPDWFAREFINKLEEKMHGLLS